MQPMSSDLFFSPDQLSLGINMGKQSKFCNSPPCWVCRNQRILYISLHKSQENKGQGVRRGELIGVRGGLGVQTSGSFERMKLPVSSLSYSRVQVCFTESQTLQSALGLQVLSFLPWCAGTHCLSTSESFPKGLFLFVHCSFSPLFQTL